MRDTTGPGNESRIVPVLRDTFFARLTAHLRAIQHDANTAGARFSPVKFDIRHLAEGHMDISTEENEAKSDLTDWSEEQERSLETLFLDLEEQNGRIINTLASYATQVGA